jgi:hypothetical protein
LRKYLVGERQRVGGGEPAEEVGDYTLQVEDRQSVEDLAVGLQPDGVVDVQSGTRPPPCLIRHRDVDRCGGDAPATMQVGGRRADDDRTGTTGQPPGCRDRQWVGRALCLHQDAAPGRADLTPRDCCPHVVLAERRDGGGA